MVGVMSSVCYLSKKRLIYRIAMLVFCMNTDAGNAGLVKDGMGV